MKRTTIGIVLLATTGALAEMTVEALNERLNPDVTGEHLTRSEGFMRGVLIGSPILLTGLAIIGAETFTEGVVKLP